MSFQKYFFLLTLCGWLTAPLVAQPMLPLEAFVQAPDTASSREEAKTRPEAKHVYRPLTIRLNPDGSNFVRFIMWHQVWATTNNLDVAGAKLQLQPSIRRSRFLAYAQVSPKFLILTHFGLNGLTPDNLTNLGSDGDAPQLFLHDAWVEFKLLDELYIGGGLHYWKGLTRLSGQSTLNFLTLDQTRPFVHWHSLGITDQFARHLGVYAKGAVGRIDYRLALNAPSRRTLGDGKDFGGKSDLMYTGVSETNNRGAPTGNTIVEGYFRYNFWETESIKLPYMSGTYLDTKKVLALGAGFFSHPDGMFNMETREHAPVRHLAVDAFLNLPTGKGAFTAYGSWIKFDYGENYISRWGGTGTNLYAHLGYYWKAVKLMPYLAFQTSNYQGLDQAPNALNIGVNYFILGHHAKLTLEYHQIANDPRESGASNLRQVRLQAHVFL
jgi:hypothetical protein